MDESEAMQSREGVVRVGECHCGALKVIAAGAVTSGLMRVQLDARVQHFHEHDEHRKFFYDHFVVKGAEAATACAATLDKIGRLRSPCRRASQAKDYWAHRVAGLI
jgi:6,7-dimethyl-8-ribityllumazine synthase